MTRSRCRARAVSSRSWASTTAGRIRSSQPDGRLDASGEPLQAGRVLRPGAARHVGDRHRPGGGAGRAAGGPGGAVDLLGRQPERDRRRGGIEPGGGVAVERPDPQLVAALDVRDGRIHDQRRLARPRGIPVPPADQDHRAGLLGERADGGRAAFHEGLHGPDDDAGAAQPRLAGRRGRDLDRVVARRHPAEVQRDRQAPAAREGRPAERAPGRAGSLADVDQRLAGREGPGHDLHLVRRRPRWTSRAAPRRSGPGCRRRAGAR